MARGLPLQVKANIEKCRSAATAAVAAYNRPGTTFRTCEYIVLITIAWTALLHAVFYKRGQRPWYTKGKTGAGTGRRYEKIDGEPRHWDLTECTRRYFAESNPPERKNLEFIVGLRNKIEHRHLPELDATLYGECQAALLNLEELLVSAFGKRYALAEQLAVSLQFSQVIPPEKKAAARVLAKGASKSVTDYVEKFRGKLPPETLNSMRYSYSVFLVPRVANRASAADAAVTFIKVDEASAEELARLERLNVLIKDKHIPIANLGMIKASDVVREVASRTSGKFNLSLHTRAWRYYTVRPPAGSAKPADTKSQFCAYDPVHKDYVYTRAWVELLVRDLGDPAKRAAIVNQPTN